MHSNHIRPFLLHKTFKVAVADSSWEKAHRPYNLILPVVIIISIISSCAIPKEEKSIQPSNGSRSRPTEAVSTLPAPGYLQTGPQTEQEAGTSLKCAEDTKAVFNSCGIEVFPFVRTAFYDFDNDGTDEMIVGSKDGILRLYKNRGTATRPSWELKEGYFNGIRAGAFSAPAVGDIDNDGMPEIILGSGGFSTDSGKVTIFKNSGTISKPVWKKISMPQIDVGNDATPALFDIDKDGKPDLIVGNSTGNLSLFRNRTRNKRVVFEKDPEYFKGIRLGNYVAPTVTSSGDRIIIIAGNDMGKIFRMERAFNGKSAWAIERLDISSGNFASPTFIVAGPGKKDLVISGDSGQIYHFTSSDPDYRDWKRSSKFFDERVLPGLACAPSITDFKDRSLMVVGNINGEIKFFEYAPSEDKLPWKERPEFSRNLKQTGFSRGVLTTWQGKLLLITGQQDGILKAFLDSGTGGTPIWTEQRGFFRSLPRIMHAAPAVFDIDGDGKWELVIGDVDGNIRGFRYRIGPGNMPVWEKMDETFRETKVGRFSSPALFRDADKLYLLSGQQDGRISVFSSDRDDKGRTVFHKGHYIEGIMMNNHSSPSALVKKGMIEISVGDYYGNLKHFACKNTLEKSGRN